MTKTSDFNRGVPLPPGLTVTAIRKSIEYIEKELSQLVDLYYEQANVFSALVGIYGVRALDSFSVYEKKSSPRRCAAALSRSEAARNGHQPAASALSRIEGKQAPLGVAVTPMITRVGTLSGAIWSIPPSPLNLASP
jgi:hypothetical protein